MVVALRSCLSLQADWLVHHCSSLARQALLRWDLAFLKDARAAAGGGVPATHPDSGPSVGAHY